MAAAMPTFRNYREFWPFYLRQHARPGTRRLHFVGTTLALAAMAGAALLADPWLLVAAPLLAYGAAWAGHFFIENNAPATFTYPLWSLIGDFHMYGLMLAGRMEAEIARQQASPAGR